MTNPHIYIVAVESSADYLGAELARHLKNIKPKAILTGIGGAEMAALGIESQMDTSGLAILGFVEGMASYPMILKKVDATAESIIANDPDAVVLIDSWGFMIRVAKSLKKKGFTGKIIKYVAPQVWAMREGRAAILAKHVDHLMSLHSFDAPYFEKYGLPVSYIGNPIFEIDYRSGNGKGLRREYGFAPKDEVVSIFFGSRYSEISTLAKPFADAIEALKSRRPHVKFISPVSVAIAPEVSAAAASDLRLQDIILLPEERKFDVFAASNVALACSGTITTQLACAGVPTVVAYRLNLLTYMAAKVLFKPDYISIVNIAADKPLMPEFIQGDVTGANLSGALNDLLNDQDALKARSQALIDQTDLMKGDGGTASCRAAEVVLDAIGRA